MRQRKRNIFKIQQNHQSSKKKMQAFVINLPRRVYRRDANVCHWWFWQVEKWVWRGVVCTEKNECRGGGDRTEYSCQMSSGLEKWLIWKSTDLHLDSSQVVLTGDNSRKQPWIDEKRKWNAKFQVIHKISSVRMRKEGIKQETSQSGKACNAMVKRGKEENFWRRVLWERFLSVVFFLISGYSSSHWKSLRRLRTIKRNWRTNDDRIDREKRQPFSLSFFLSIIGTFP